MPEFQLITEGATDWDALPGVVQGFIEAMFFTNQVPGDVIFDFTGDAVETRYVSMLDGEAPRSIKAHWGHPAIQEAIQEGTLDGEIPTDASVADLDPEGLKRIKDWVLGWVADHNELVCAAITQHGYDGNRLGNDLWYTSQGHGVGFSDRSELDVNERDGETLADRLTAAALYAVDMNPMFDFDSQKIHIN